MNPLKLIGWAFVGLLLVAGFFWWNRHQDAQYAADLAIWKSKYHAADSALADRNAQRDTATAANTASIPVYIKGRDRIIHDTVPSHQAANVKACFELADQRISACEKARRADSAVIAAQDSVIKILKDKPEPKERRFQFYGAAGYSVRVDSAGTQMAPAFRAGIDSKLLGPIRLATDAQLSLPRKGHATPMWQGNIMARINF